MFDQYTINDNGGHRLNTQLPGFLRNCLILHVMDANCTRWTGYLIDHIDNALTHGAASTIDFDFSFHGDLPLKFIKKYRAYSLLEGQEADSG
jgi:hypothetical protein